MPQIEQTPVESEHVIGGDRGTTLKHPAFGQILASRVSATPGAVLYGSDFRHHHFMTIRIKRSELHRNLSKDWYHSREELIEVALSEAQWATFVSSPNSGDGVPCTIEQLSGTSLPSIPLRKQEDEHKKEANSKLAEAASRVQEAIDEIEGEIGKSLSGAKKKQILESLHRLRRDMEDSLPFVAESLGKHMEKTVERAKIEVNAYIESTVRRAGWAALTGTTPLQLGSGEDPPG